mmetsp:Transcript_448/g.901  ORF Transcript_448/g.901 Transcript_448/m.901 type:complete len:82 (+) Transcript_448:273-518(+)
MIRNKKLRQHPAYLIATICIVEAAFVWMANIESEQVRPTFFICYFSLHELLYFTTMPFMFKNTFDTMRFLVKTMEFQFQVC